MVWAMIAGTALVTFLLRFSFLGAVRPHAFPERFRTALRFVAPAVLAAIVVPQVVIRDDVVRLAHDNPRLIAALVAALIAWWTRSVIWTIAGGMVALWIAQWALA
jgi:branched-subunit amino acid transport protein